MVLKESWIFVLLGNNNIGKTTFQKKILYNYLDGNMTNCQAEKYLSCLPDSICLKPFS
jgi:hypothetical protein